MATSLTGRRVVVTRSAEDNASLGDALAALGAEVIDLPLVEVVAAADDGQALRSAVARLEDYRYVALTSANGVLAVATALAKQQWPDGVTVLPVGPVTAALAAEVGMAVGPVPPSATAADLVAEVPAWVGSQPCRVLAPLAELAGDTVVNGLSNKGYTVDRVEAYRTVAPSAEKIAGRLPELEAGADAVLFFSPSAVDRFIGLATAPEVAICIGPSTAAKAAGDGRWKVITADPHTETGVIETLLGALGCGEPTAQS